MREQRLVFAASPEVQIEGPRVDGVRSWMTQRLRSVDANLLERLNRRESIKNITLNTIRTGLERGGNTMDTAKTLYLQMALHKLKDLQGKPNFNPGRVDGFYAKSKAQAQELERTPTAKRAKYVEDYGSNTQRAVLAFQTDKGLTRDGLTGPQTLGQMKEELTTEITNMHNTIVSTLTPDASLAGYQSPPNPADRVLDTADSTFITVMKGSDAYTIGIPKDNPEIVTIFKNSTISTMMKITDIGTITTYLVTALDAA